MARQDAQLARNVVLALVVHTPRHGWAIHEQLSPIGDVGRAWTLSRQLVYRAIDTLVEDGLVKRATPKDGGGGDKVIISPTAAGKRIAMKWLDCPVSHLRDVRTELVLKVMLREKLELPLAPFLTLQHEIFDPLITSINKDQSNSPVNLWRKESANAVKRYLSRLERNVN
ncbi:MAG: PadR family transcriptional regulator [Ilumatobacteraceae bacterium]|nr:PadR family transcriptional regulator [Ilumatobacteraceae bacterium]